MNWRRRLRPRALAVCVALGTAVAGLPAGAVEAPPGSANFTPPAYVPNYFSNESGPLRGGAAARIGRPGAGPRYAAPAPRRSIAAAPRRYARHSLRHAAKPRVRVRLAHGRASARRHIVHAEVARRGRAEAHRHIVRAEVARRGRAEAHRHIVRAEVTRRGRAETHRHIVRTDTARRDKPSRTSVAHARTRPARSKAVAARRRPAPGKAKHLVRGRG